MEISIRHPAAMVLGVPVFGPDAPPERVSGRRIGNWFANLETLWGGVQDSLFGFRLYPLSPAVRIMESIRTAGDSISTLNWRSGSFGLESAR